MSAFKVYDEVAVVEYDPETVQPLDGGEVLYGTVTGVRAYAVTVRYGAAPRLFLLDSKGRAWRWGGRRRAVPLCCRSGCDDPITGTPVTDPEDPLRRQFCSPGCLEGAAETWAEGHYPSGVAT